MDRQLQATVPPQAKLTRDLLRLRRDHKEEQAHIQDNLAPTVNRRSHIALRLISHSRTSNSSRRVAMEDMFVTTMTSRKQCMITADK